MSPAQPAAGPGFYDPSAETAVTAGRLPHWSQPGVVTFITFRTWDSIPRAVLLGLLNERARWLRTHRADPTRAGRQTTVAREFPAVARGYRKMVAEGLEAALDACHGACPLRDPALSAIVADSLRRFDGGRYTLFDYVVMPNHVHLLAAFPAADAPRKQCEAWKHFTAVKLNHALGRMGRFWESESFDHLVRTDEQFRHLRRYIADNPTKARLRAGEYAHYSRPLPDLPSAGCG